jgi:signal transduction histidine kinase
MNLKRRLILANASTVIIPVLITVLSALAFIYIGGKLSDSSLTFESVQTLTQVQYELKGSENGVLNEKPEVVKEVGFQNYLQERLAKINGEVIIVKNDQTLFESRNFSKIDIAKFMEAGMLQSFRKPVKIGNTSYTVQAISFNFKEGDSGIVLLLAPVYGAATNLVNFLLFTGILFALSFGVTNLIISYQFSRSILRPLNNLQKAAAEISSGNLNHPIVEEGDEEIQELCRDLELMRIKLKELIHTQLKYEDNRKLLVSSISHDLKTPVTAIKGYVEGLLDGIAQTPEKKDKYLKTIYSKAHLVDTMIDDLLLYAKLDLNQIPFNLEKTDLEKFLQDGLRESEHDMEQSQIQLLLHSELKAPQEILLDRERFKRVIMNILDNSRKYMNKEQGQITVLLRETHSSLIIEIRDNGSGINEYDLPRIFERFYRSDTARSEIKGSGLGLAIAKQIVEGHEGRIWAVNHKDEGISIMISLPKSLPHSH